MERRIGYPEALYAGAPERGHSAVEALLRDQDKGLLRFLTCGSVDDGKSTLIGRLLFESQLIYEDQFATVEKDSRRFGTTGDDIDFALLVDGLEDERQQGITIDVAYRFFTTNKRSFIVADTPGHEQYTRNMATGASNSDLAIILVDARKGVLPQTKRHATIASLLLDGDNVRHGLNRDLGFTDADRVENIRRVGEVARLLADAGLLVLCSFISPFLAERQMVRERADAGEFLEIFVDTPIEECMRRDPKGLYAKARRGEIKNFTGFDSPYEPPTDPELHLRTTDRAPEDLAEQVMSLLRERGMIR